MRRRVLQAATIGLVVLLAIGAAGGPGPTASGQTGLGAAFVPSVDAGRVLATGSTLARMLEVATGYRVRAEVPTSYAATIEAMCAGRGDIGVLATFAYVLANQRCGAEARLVRIRQNKPLFVARVLYRSALTRQTPAD